MWWVSIGVEVSIEVSICGYLGGWSHNRTASGEGHDGTIGLESLVIF